MNNEARFALILFLSYLLFALYILSQDANAYMVNKAKSVDPINIPKTLPDKIIIDKSMINTLNNCHASSQSAAYQAGYADGCTWVLEQIGIRTKKYSEKPKFQEELNTPNQNKIIFNYDFKKFVLNLSLYKVQWQNASNSFWLNESIVYNKRVNISLQNQSWFNKGWLNIYGR
jgi:hypothetical protein